jgi:hypothetical protein
VVCRDAGVQPLSVVLQNGEVRALELPPCFDPSSTTTTSTTLSDDDDDDAD